MTMRPDSTWCPSPNFHSDPSRRITAVVIHATATGGLESPKNWLCDPASNASAHYLISREGAVLHLVHESDVAWHAGESAWNGMEHVNPKTGVRTMNNCSVGIELVNDNTGQMPYPDPQLAAAAQLVAAICQEHGVKLEDVVGHLDIAPGRKTDPAVFPWDNFRGRLKAAGIA
jgi:N-acetylmuramoyl-L-alanine amidase